MVSWGLTFPNKVSSFLQKISSFLQKRTPSHTHTAGSLVLSLVCVTQRAALCEEKAHPLSSQLSPSFGWVECRSPLSSSLNNPVQQIQNLNLTIPRQHSQAPEHVKCVTSATHIRLHALNVYVRMGMSI